jgi:hypothetical protein
MQIRQIEIDLPASHVLDQLRKEYFGKPYGSVMASFDPQTLVSTWDRRPISTRGGQLGLLLSQNQQDIGLAPFDDRN